MMRAIQSGHTWFHSGNVNPARSPSYRPNPSNWLPQSWSHSPRSKKWENLTPMPQPKTKTPRPILVPSEVFRGERLQLAREFRGFTQEKLADAVAASPTLVRYCESGKKREPTPDLVEAFGAVLGFEPEFFYGNLQDV